MLQTSLKNIMKGNIKLLLVSIAILSFIIPIMYKLHQEDQRAYQKCIQNNSEKYCANVVFGIY